MKAIGFGLAGLIALIALSFGMGVVDLGFKSFFGVRHENIKREIFEESKSHVHGTIKNLSRLRLEYKTSKDESHRAALKEMILMESSSFGTNKLPYGLQTFIRSL